MPNAIEISASSMTGLLGAVEASKAAYSTQVQKDKTNHGEYDLSRYKRGTTSKIKVATHRSNKGVQSKDSSSLLNKKKKSLKLSTVPPSVQDQLAMEALERKSKIYEATILGTRGGLSEKQLEACPLDIDAKRASMILEEEYTNSEPSNNSEEEEENYAKPSTSSSSTLPPKSFTGRISSSIQKRADLSEEEQSEEDWIETQDEFGRDILVPASSYDRVKKTRTLDPQHTLAFVQTESASHLQDIGAQYGPQTSFPILECAPRGGEGMKKEEEERIEKYFDAKAERRQLGTGFYALSSNPEERKKQQEELAARETHTKQVRASRDQQNTTVLSTAQIALEARKRLVQLKKDEIAKKRQRKS